MAGSFDTGGFKRQYPSTGALRFDGGKNSKFEVSLIEDNESPDCKNVVFDAGSVGTRQGSVKVNTLPVSFGTFTGLYTRLDNNGTGETMVAWAGANMYALAGTSFITVPSGQGVFQTGTRICWAQAENYGFIGQSGTTSYKWDGTRLTLHGIPAPATTHSVASNGAGLLTASGNYQYKVTYMNSAVAEGDVGPVSATFVVSATSGQLRISSIPVGATSFGVASRRLYRTVSSGTVFKLVTTIADNTTTTYDDNIPDSSLGANAPTDNGVPPQHSMMVYHKNRLFMNDVNNPNLVYYTEAGNPYVVGSLNFDSFGDNSQDLVKGLGVYQDSLLVVCGKYTYIWIVDDADESQWKKIRIQTAYGGFSPYSIAEYRDKVMYAATEQGKFVGFAAVQGLQGAPDVASVSYFASASFLKSNRIENDLFDNISSTYLNSISVASYKNKLYFTMAYGAGQTTNNRVYVYDFGYSDSSKNQEGVWVPYTGWNAEQFTVYNDNLYYADSLTGFVYKVEAGVYTDNGSAIDSYFWTKEFSGQPSEYSFFKDWRWAQLLVQNSGDWYMNVRYRVDSDQGGGNIKQIYLNPGGGLWGALLWGFGLWGGGSYQTDQRFYTDGIRGKRIQFRFDNQNVAGNWFKVHRANLFYNLKGPR